VLDHVDGLPAAIEAALAVPWSWPDGTVAVPKRRPGPPALATLERRLAALAAMHRTLGLPSPTLDHRVRELLRKTRNARARAGVRPRKMRAATADVLHALLDTCAAGSALDLRDRALLLFGFASGGRRSEIVAVQLEDLTRTPEGYACRLHVTKTDQAGAGRTVPVKGDAAAALGAWLDRLAAAGVTQGPLFRAVTRRGRRAHQRTGGAG